LFKGGMSPTKAARQTGLGRSALYRDIQARDHAWALGLRFKTDSAMTPEPSYT
jgi:DNA-binding phage protein